MSPGKMSLDSWHLLNMVPVTYSLTAEGYLSPSTMLRTFKKVCGGGGGGWCLNGNLVIGFGLDYGLGF